MIKIQKKRPCVVVEQGRVGREPSEEVGSVSIANHRIFKADLTMEHSGDSGIGHMRRHLFDELGAARNSGGGCS